MVQGSGGAPVVPREHGRVAMISLHTSPLDQPGTGDAGGMNVYVLELSKRLAERNLEVEIYTRATSSSLPPTVAGLRRRPRPPRARRPVRGAGQGRAARPAVHLRPRAAARRGRPRAGLVRPHPLPLLALRPGRRPAPRPLVGAAGAHHAHDGQGQERVAGRGRHPRADGRVLGEEQVVEAADMLIANTDLEAKQLVNLYDADPTASRSCTPGSTSRSSARRPAAARARLGIPADAVVPMFVGRLQPLKAPDVLLRAVALLLERDPSLRAPARRAGRRRPVRRPASSTPSRSPSSPRRSASATSSASCRRSAQSSLVDWYAAATLVCVPSYNESFGLVADRGRRRRHARGGGCRGRADDRRPRRGDRAARRGPRPGRLRAGDGPARRPARRTVSGSAAARRCTPRDFAWERTADRTLEVYRQAARAMRHDLDRVGDPA